MRIYEYSWEAQEKGIDLTVDIEVLMFLIVVFKERIKDAVEKDDFESARRYFKSLDVLERNLKALERDEKDADSKTE